VMLFTFFLFWNIGLISYSYIAEKVS
jgi:hypothetical protein